MNHDKTFMFFFIKSLRQLNNVGYGKQDQLLYRGSYVWLTIICTTSMLALKLIEMYVAGNMYVILAKQTDSQQWL